MNSNSKLQPFLFRPLPDWLAPLVDIALDLRWTWHHGTDPLWKAIDPETWQSTRNPWWLLQSISQERIDDLAGNQEFRNELGRMVRLRSEYLRQKTWFEKNYSRKRFGAIAYFSMEFGVGEALPLYAGGLGVLAGDYLKTASDFGLPLVGVGLLYHEGYFRQVLDSEGRQVAAHPHNDPTSLPIRPVSDSAGGWLQVSMQLPGRTLTLRVWEAQVGRVKLYLLDSNVPTNGASDRAVTYKLYDGGREMRLVQEMVLGIGGWRAVKAVSPKITICHLNEGHTAFAVLERAREQVQDTGKPFAEALCATRAGNVFTTHTPVAAGFDSFPADLVARYFVDYVKALGISMDEMLALGRRDPSNASENFNMAALAMRGCIRANGVSRLHGQVSRSIFQSLYPRWPEREVPVGHITNGVHVPSWDSKWANAMWTECTSNGCSCDEPPPFDRSVQLLSDSQIWSLRSEARAVLVAHARRHQERLARISGGDEEAVEGAGQALDPEALTLGFARRFAAYKRPNLLLTDPDRLARLLTAADRPVQLIVAGKAHPQDEEGKRLVQLFVSFARQPHLRRRVVFLEDYDMAHAKRLVQGVDLWINTPRRPMEACGTSGMKVVINGGLNLSELDGWWAEAYTPEVGWALGDGREHHESGWDRKEAEQLYELLESRIVPEFYERDAKGIPARWISRIRASIGTLAPRFGSHRMLCQYIEKAYLPALSRYKERTAGRGKLAAQLVAWQKSLAEVWPQIRFGRARVQGDETGCRFEVPVFLGDLDPDSVAIELYANPLEEDDATRLPLKCVKKLSDDYLYQVELQSLQRVDTFTLRAIPANPAVSIPIEENHILWER